MAGFSKQKISARICLFIIVFCFGMFVMYWLCGGPFQKIYIPEDWEWKEKDGAREGDAPARHGGGGAGALQASVARSSATGVRRTGRQAQS